jgi:hypothetical protein
MDNVPTNTINFTRTNRQYIKNLNGIFTVKIKNTFPDNRLPNNVLLISDKKVFKWIRGRNTRYSIMPMLIKFSLLFPQKF